MTERRLVGTGVTPQSGSGTAVWYTPEPEREETTGEPSESAQTDPEAEHDRFTRARGEAREEIRADRERMAERVGENAAEVFDAHAQFLDDPLVVEGVEREIDDGEPAERAVGQTFDRLIEQFEGKSRRVADRADDLRDVRDRLLRVLRGRERVDLSSLPEGSVVLAERLTPSDTAQLDAERVAGFATVTGGETSHAAIFARSLSLPAVVGVGEALHEVADGDAVVVDGTTGVVVIK